MPRLTDRTPIRQVARAYSALLGINHSLHVLAESATVPSDVEPSGPVRLVDAMGLRLLLDPRSLVDRSVIDHGSWELDRIEWLLTTARSMAAGRQAMFLDVGAYWGLYAMLAARAELFDEVIAFEPDRHNFAQMQAQLFLNELSTRIDARHAAVSSTSGSVHLMFSRSHPDGNRAGVGVVPHDQPGEDVQAVTIDDVVDVTGRFVVAKIDVEGHEHAVLDGMERLIARNEVLFQVEVFEAQRVAVMPRMEELGLRVVHEMYPDCFVTNA